MKEIKISIITVSYNSRETIIDTLKSVLKAKLPTTRIYNY